MRFLLVKLFITLIDFIDNEL